MPNVYFALYLLYNVNFLIAVSSIYLYIWSQYFLVDLLVIQIVGSSNVLSCTYCCCDMILLFIGLSIIFFLRLSTNNYLLRSLLVHSNLDPLDCLFLYIFCFRRQLVKVHFDLLAGCWCIINTNWWVVDLRFGWHFATMFIASSN